DDERHRQALHHASRRGTPPARGNGRTARGDESATRDGAAARAERPDSVPRLERGRTVVAAVVARAATAGLLGYFRRRVARGRSGVGVEPTKPWVARPDRL